jgi:hypothetical protein
MVEIKNGKVVRTLDESIRVMADLFINGENWKVITKDKDGIEVAKVNAYDRQVMEQTRKTVKFGDVI